MSRLFLFLTLVAFLSCDKKTTASKAVSPESIEGEWILKGSDGSGPAGTLSFSSKNNKNMLSFDCSGSPGPNWPSAANTEYKFENNKLSFKTYYDPNAGFYDVTSFTWIEPGKEFEVKRHQLLHYMSADYTVRYVRKF